MSSSLAIPFAALAFCTWAVYLGGLASMQAKCADTPTILGTAMVGGVEGFSGALPCYKVYRYWWFVMSIEFVVVVGVALAAITGKLHSVKNAFLGLFAITALLYIQASNSFLSLLNTDYYDTMGSSQLHRARTVVAGAIMTATANCLMVFVLGMSDSEPSATREVPHEKGPEVTAATAV